MILYQLLLCITFSVIMGLAADVIMMRPCKPGSVGAPVNGNNIEVESLTVEGCDKLPCTITRGRTHLVEGKATFNYSAKTVTATCVIVTPNFPAVNGCEDLDICSYLSTLNGTCTKIEPGTVLYAKGSFPVPPIGPSYTGVWRLIIADDSKVPQYCGELKVTVQDATGTGFSKIATDTIKLG